jgi:hypothetical protein
MARCWMTAIVQNTPCYWLLVVFLLAVLSMFLLLMVFGLSDCLRGHPSFVPPPTIVDHIGHVAGFPTNKSIATNHKSDGFCSHVRHCCTDWAEQRITFSSRAKILRGVAIDVQYVSWQRGTSLQVEHITGRVCWTQHSCEVGQPERSQECNI